MEGIGKGSALQKGMAVPLQDLIRRESITDEELALLRESQANSDHLVLMEKQAFAAMKGLFEDGNGNFTVQRAPNRDFAVKLLFSEDYTVEKARIMLHPVELLNVQASEIAEGNYAARCDISSANEIGELCANFNLISWKTNVFLIIRYSSMALIPTRDKDRIVRTGR